MSQNARQECIMEIKESFSLRSEKEKKEKSKFWIKRDCAMHSLREVECFLRNLDKVYKTFYLYKFLR